MKFEEIIEHVRNNGKFRRDNWQPHEWVTYKCNKFDRDGYFVDEKEVMHDIKELFYFNELLDNKWEIFNENNS